MQDPHTRVLDGIYYRIKALAEAGDILGPARAPEGRSHRVGQRALYLSETSKGCLIATQRYVDASTPQRAIFALNVSGATVVDLRDDLATAALGIDTTDRAMEWQSLRARGLPSPTWDLADRVRELGLDGMLYASRSDPRLAHLTLFRWNTPDTSARVASAAPPVPVE